MAQPPQPAQECELGALWKGAQNMAAAGTYPAQLISQPIVDDSNWEPDGVTLQVRFCEGGATYRLHRDSRRYSPNVAVQKEIALLQDPLAPQTRASDLRRNKVWQAVQHAISDAEA